MRKVPTPHDLGPDELQQTVLCVITIFASNVEALNTLLSWITRPIIARNIAPYSVELCWVRTLIVVVPEVLAHV